MKKTKILLPILLIVSLVLVISSVVVSLTAGINLGIDFAGGKQIEIQVPELGKTDGYEKAVADVLSEYDLTIDSCFTEEKFTEKYFVVKINTQEISEASAAEIKSKIATKLGLPAENVSDVLTISGSVTQKTLLSVSFAVLGIMVAIFLASWIRYGIMEALSILFGTLHNMIISFAVVLITRIPLTIPTCTSIFALSTVFAGLYCVVLEKARESLGTNTKDANIREVYPTCLKKSLVIVLMVLVSAVVLGISALFVAQNVIKLFALSSIVCAFVVFYSLVVSSHLGGYLVEAKHIDDKRKLSKNN